MGLSGNLRTMALPDLLQWVAAAGKTGVLSFNRHSITKRIFASEGRIIGSASNDPIDFIGQWLVSCGRISEDQLRIALGEHERSRTYIGTVLVQMRAISQEDLIRMLVLKTEEIIYTLFHWEDAGFEFAAGEMDAVAFQISLRVEDVLLKGVRRYDDIQRIRRVFPHSEVILRRTSLVPPPEVMQNPHARRILEAIDGLRSINAIALHAHASEFIVSKFLFELHQAGYAEIIAIPAPLATSGVTHRAEALVGTPGVSARVETIVSATTGVAARSSGAFPRAEAITGAGRLAGVGTSGAFPGGPYSSGAFAGGESLVATSGAYAKPDASVGTSGAYARPSADNADEPQNS